MWLALGLVEVQEGLVFKVGARFLAPLAAQL